MHYVTALIRRITLQRAWADGNLALFQMGLPVPRLVPWELKRLSGNMRRLDPDDSFHYPFKLIL